MNVSRKKKKIKFEQRPLIRFIAALQKCKAHCEKCSQWALSTLSHPAEQVQAAVSLSNYVSQYVTVVSVFFSI